MILRILIVWMGAWMCLSGQLVGQVDTAEAHRCFMRGYELLKAKQYQNDSTFQYLTCAEEGFRQTGFPCRAKEAELYHIFGDQNRTKDWRTAKKQYFSYINSEENGHTECPVNKRLGEAYYRLGVCYFMVNIIDSSEYCIRKALPFFMEFWPKGHWKIASGYNILGAIELRRENDQKALVYFEKALAQYEPLGSKYNSNIARVKNNIATLYLGLNQFEEALRYRMEAVSLWKDIFGLNSPEVAAAYNDIGVLYEQVQYFEKAELYFNLALSTISTSKAFDHQSLPTIYSNLGTIQSKKGDFKGAETYYRKSIEIRNIRTVGDTIKLVNTNCYLAATLAKSLQFEEAIALLLDQRRLLLNLGMGNSREMAECEEYLGNAYRQAGQYVEALEHMQNGMKIELLIREELSTIPTLGNYGSILWERGNLSESLESYLQAESVILSQRPIKNYHLQSIYDDLGSVYQAMGSFPASLSYHKQALSIVQNHYSDYSWIYSGILMDIGWAFQGLGEQDSALTYLTQAFTFIDESEPAFQFYQAQILNSIGETYLEIDQAIIAQKKVNKALQIFIDILPKNHPKIVETHVLLARIYAERQLFRTALEQCRQAEHILQSIDHPNPNHKISQYVTRANIEHKREQHQAALQSFQQALIIGSLSFSSTTPTDNPPIDSLLQFPGLVEVLTGKAQVLGRKAESLPAAIQTIKLAIAHRERITQGFDTESRVHLQGKTLSSSETGCALAYQAYQQNPKASYAADLFSFSEQSKANQLRMDQREKVARQVSGIPDSLTTLLYDLQYQRHQLETKLIGGESKGKSTDLRNELFTIKRRQDSLIAHFETTYPAYHQLKYNNQVVSVSDIQQALQPGTALLEYFSGDSNLYVILIRPDTLIVRQLPPIDPADIIAFQEGIRKGQQQNKGQYEQIAYQLYQDLIQPITAWLPDRLIIVPDRALSYLPFEALLTEPIADPNKLGYKAYLYFLRTKTISYAFSATLWLETQKKATSIAPKPFLGIAPYAYQGSDTWIPLPSSDEEILSIQALMGGEAWIAEEAQRDTWIEDAKDYQILHLATHGKILDQHPSLNHLAFFPTEDSTDQDILTLADLYTVQLNTEMAVLSACKTALGKLMPGEGIASVARGFTYAGARSVVATLWKVDDPITKDLMIAFYENLEAGMDKATALRQAKLQIIEQESKSPFFWAGPVAMGDMRPIPRPLDMKWLWWGLGFLLLGISVIALKRSK